MTSINRSSDPVCIFARREWGRLTTEFGFMEAYTDLAKVQVYIDPWEQILARNISPRLKETLASAEPKKDSYWIEIQEDAVILSGQSPRSTLYAVYEAFRLYRGVQWIYPGEKASLSTPRHAVTKAPALPSVHLFEPDFERRGFVIENLYDPEYIHDMVDWLAKNRANEIFFTFTLWDKIKDEIAPEIAKRGLQLTLGGHSMKFFLNKTEAEGQQAADHPYTAKKQLDYSDLAWQEKVFDDIAAYCASTPGLARVSLWPEDIPAQQDKSSSFLPQYIAFTERLQARLEQALPDVEVEHIAYNAGLSWDMLDRGDARGSVSADTLLAYWGRDYRHPLAQSPVPSDQKAEAILQDWVQEVQSRGRKLSVFEYYSDHFMFSALFPSIPSMIVQDAAYYRGLGVDGLTNLIVPCPGYPDYPWKWAAGLNSFVFSRAVWGEKLETILEDYYTYYPEEDRELAKRWMAAVEETVTAVTGWNIPLFPGRIVDINRIPDNEGFRPEITNTLSAMHQRLSEAYGAPSESAAASPAAVYMRHLIELSDKLLHAWSGQ